MTAVLSALLLLSTLAQPVEDEAVVVEEDVVEVEQASVPPYGLTPYLQRVARCESANYRPDVVYGPTRGRAGEIGLAQLHPRGLLPLFMAWVPEHLGVEADPWKPEQQARFMEWAFANGLGSHWSCAR